MLDMPVIDVTNPLEVRVVPNMALDELKPRDSILIYTNRPPSEPAVPAALLLLALSDCPVWN